MDNFIINDRWYNDRDRNKERDAERIITTAAKLIMSEIREKRYDTSTYPTSEDIRNQDVQWLPTGLKIFREVLMKSTLKQQSIGQSIVFASRPRSVIPTIPFGA